MPNYIKALILLLIAASVALYFARDILTAKLSREQYRSYRNVWLFLTVCLFVAPGIWIFYAIVLLVLLTHRYAADIDRVTLYCFLLFAAPSIEVSIPGIAGIDKLIDINLQRILVLVVLLPLLKKSLAGGLYQNPSDKWLVLYVVLSAVLYYRGDNHTHATRQVVLMLLEVVVPYFVISRTIKSLQDFNRVLLALMFTLSLIAAEAVMEALRHWELYNQTGLRLIGERIHRFSEERAGILRARSIFLSPLIVGYAMVFLLAILFYLKPYFTRKVSYWALTGIACAALLVSFSRATWIGAIVFLIVYGILSSSLAKVTWYFVAGSVAGYVALTTTALGQRVMNLLPFIGTERSETFDYRQRLLESGIQVIKQYPLFGHHNYLQLPEMQQMRQGQGIIDTVNGFLSIAMYRGLPGLFFFVMIFVSSMAVLYKANKNTPQGEPRLGELGRMLLSYMVASMLIISTVSNADFVPVLYFLSASLMAAWVGLYRRHQSPIGKRSEIVVRRNLNPRRAR